MWTYRQRTGELERDGKYVSTGYSGHGEGKNNPELQERACVGPIPRGHWSITQYVPATATHGPAVLRLAPRPDTLTYDRDGFLIHGDSVRKPGTASLGCIILPRTVRDLIWMSGDRDLEVTA